MTINDVDFSVDCYDIVLELKNQLALNNIPLLNKIVDTSNNVQVCCPYHKAGQERRPSAGIRKSDGTFHCLACNEVHSLPEVISHCFGHTDDLLGTWGWQWLLKNFVSVQVEERKDVELDFNRNSLAILCKSDNASHIGYASGEVSENYKGDETQDSEVRGCVTEEELDGYRYTHPYWRKRGVTDERIIELFDLGYDKGTDCITMPVRDSKGQCVFVARRSVKTKYFNYPKDVSKPLYGLYEYNLEREKLANTYYCKGRASGKTYMLSQIKNRLLNVFICESMIDALLLWQSGFFAFALNGLGSESQIVELKQLPIRQYILCTDNDTAGKKAREHLRKELGDIKLLSEINFPNGIKDVGECTKEQIDNILDWEVL